MLDRNEDVHGIVATVKLALEVIQVFTDIPPLQKIFLSDIMLRLFGPKPTDSFGVGKLMGMARELVASRFSSSAKEQKDLLVSEVIFYIVKFELKQKAGLLTQILGLLSPPWIRPPICGI